MDETQGHAPAARNLTLAEDLRAAVDELEAVAARLTRAINGYVVQGDVRSAKVRAAARRFEAVSDSRWALRLVQRQLRDAMR